MLVVLEYLWGCQNVVTIKKNEWLVKLVTHTYTCAYVYAHIWPYAHRHTHFFGWLFEMEGGRGIICWLACCFEGHDELMTLLLGAVSGRAENCWWKERTSSGKLIPSFLICKLGITVPLLSASLRFHQTMSEVFNNPAYRHFSFCLWQQEIW